MGVKKNTAPPPEGVRQRMTARIALILLMAVILGFAYLSWTWIRYQEAVRTEAVRLAESLETLLPMDDIEALSRADAGTDTPAYVRIKQKLVRLVERTSLVHYAYLIGSNNGSTYLLVDSNTNMSSEYSPLERFREELTDPTWIPFETDRSNLTRQISNEWGTWIRVLVPVKSQGEGEIVAILGLSYSAQEWHASLWKRMTPDIIVVSSLLLLSIALLALWRNHRLLADQNRTLIVQEALYRTVFEQAPMGIALVDYEKGSIESTFNSINPMGARIIGRSVEALKEIPWPDLNHPDDLARELPLFEAFSKGEIGSYLIEKRLIRPDGSIIWVSLKVAGFFGSPLHGRMYLCLMEDITGRKQAEEALYESERSKAVLLSHLPGMAYRCRNDGEWTMEFVSEGSLALTGYPPHSLIENRDISYRALISPEYRDMLQVDQTRTQKANREYRHEYEILTESGQRKWVLELGQGICDESGAVSTLEGIVLDLSEQKKKEHQITYLQEHDFLTGLFNRNRMTQERALLDRPEHWPLSIAVCDIDGLRMINDAYGHMEGDRLIVQTAKLIQNCCPGEAALGRISGGEFMLLLPHTDGNAAQQLIQRILAAIDRFNHTKEVSLYEISLSIGCSTKYSGAQSTDAAIKAAEDHLRNKKLLNQKSLHSAIVFSIMATLYAKSQETEEHGQRLGRFCALIGTRLGLAQRELDDLQLLSKLHDIGKIGVDDAILNKPGKLTEEEWAEMRQHPEIGHRIAMSTPQLEHIALYILHHHERWDGTGYPAGLKGEEIPLIARILAIADAYDAMTEDRVYRKGMSHEAAIAELEQYAGTQFDPDITGIFIQLLREQDTP